MQIKNPVLFILKITTMQIKNPVYLFPLTRKSTPEGSGVPTLKAII